MPRNQSIPEDAFIVRTYAELASFVQAFVDGVLNLLIIVGKPGLQKSRIVKDIIGGVAVCWIDGNATPFGIYGDLGSVVGARVTVIAARLEASVRGQAPAQRGGDRGQAELRDDCRRVHGVTLRGQSRLARAWSPRVCHRVWARSGQVPRNSRRQFANPRFRA